MTQPVRVIAFPGAPNLPVFVADELGLFVDNGVELEFETTPSSIYQFEQLSAGNFDIGMTAFDNVVAYAEGQGAAQLGKLSDFVAVMGATQLELSLVATPDIKKHSDLAGKSLALDAKATGFAFVLYEMLKRSGVDLDSVDMVEVGSTPDRFNAVKSGEHAATLTIEPFTSLARAAGLGVIDVSTDLFDAYQGGSVTVSRQILARREDDIRGWMAGYLSGLKWTLDPVNFGAAKEILLKRMPAIKPGVADAVMSSLLSPRSGLTPGAEILTQGVKTVLELRSQYGGGDVLTDGQRYIDTSLHTGLFVAD